MQLHQNILLQTHYWLKKKKKKIGVMATLNQDTFRALVMWETFVTFPKTAVSSQCNSIQTELSPVKF